MNTAAQALPGQFSLTDPRHRQQAGARLRALLQTPEQQQQLIEFILRVAQDHTHAQASVADLIERVEAAACIAITQGDDDAQAGRLLIASMSAEPDGCSVVFSNVVRFWKTGTLPARWTV